MINLNISIKGDKEFIKAMAGLAEKEADKAIRRAVRYAGQAAPAAIAKGIGSRYAITSARVKEGVKLSYRDNGMSCAVMLSSRPTTVMSWGAKVRGHSSSLKTQRIKRGVMTWKILKKGGVKRSRNAWLMPGKQDGGLLPFHRIGKGRKDIDVIHGPSILRSVISGAHADQLKTEIEVTLGKRLQSRLMDGLNQHLRRS